MDSGAYLRVRLDGRDVTSELDVADVLATAGRRLPKGRLIGERIDATEHGEHWDQFLDGGQPNWSDVVIAGQSPGAGQAFLIGMLPRRPCGDFLRLGG
jgi:hypothetical protein